MIWTLRARWYLWTKYKFDWDAAGTLAIIIRENDPEHIYTPKEAVDEEMSYWGE